MASPPSAFKEFEQQLTCPVCLDIYTNPKILPCHHSFCQHCLEGLSVNIDNNIQAGVKYYIECPTCRTSTELPEPTGPAAFPVAFHINNLKEVYSLMKQEKAMNCSKHDDPLRIFCETCEEVICGYCTVADHRNHNYTPIKDSYDKHHKELETSLSPVKKMMDDIINVLIAFNKKRK